MRTFVALLTVICVVVVCGGCKTAEVNVFYPLAGLHVVAKFEANDEHAPEAVVLKR